MKQLKRLSLKSSRILNSTEMKDIRGGAIARAGSCDPLATDCSGDCTTSLGTSGTCQKDVLVNYYCACVSSGTPEPTVTPAPWY